MVKLAFVTAMARAEDSCVSPQQLRNWFGRFIDQRHRARAGSEEFFVHVDADRFADRGDEVGRCDGPFDNLGNLSVTGPTEALSGETGTINVSWSGLEVATHLGVITHSDGIEPLEVTLIEIQN